MSQGWIKLHREIQDNPFWKSETFTRGQAWVDLLILANHKDGFIYVRGNKVSVKRGQVGWSQKRLSERWDWSRNKVRKFLQDLEEEQQIRQHKSNVSTVITLINYDQYQSKNTKKNSRRTAEGQQRDTNKNDKNAKKSVAPTKKEVENYFREKGNMLENDIPLEAEKFINHYADQDWKKSNGTKITNWHRQAGTWQANYQQWNEDRLDKKNANNRPKQIVV
jgi:hypothetical protein